jgi:hypothetical protein
VRTANGSGARGSPAQSERVDAQTVARATGGAGGAATNGIAPHAYVWIGSVYPDRAETLSNLVDGRGRSVAPAQAADARGILFMADNLILRATQPDAEGVGFAIGVIGRGAPVKIDGVEVVVRGEWRDYWARVNLAPGTPVPLQFAFDNPVAGTDQDFIPLFGSLGYRPSPAAGPAGVAPGTAELSYCGERDRARATRLAGLATRWLNEVPGMENAVAVPRSADNCAGDTPSPLVLRVAFAPSPAAWLNGRWGPDGNCATPTAIVVEARRIRVRGQGPGSQIIQNATADTITTDFASFTRSGQDVIVSETGTGTTLQMSRCPG